MSAAVIPIGSRSKTSFYPAAKAFKAIIPRSATMSMKWMLVILFDYADEDGGGIWVSQAKLEELSGLSRAGFYAVMGKLRKLGYVVDGGPRLDSHGFQHKSISIDYEKLKAACNLTSFSTVTEESSSQDSFDDEIESCGQDNSAEGSPPDKTNLSTGQDTEVHRTRLDESTGQDSHIKMNLPFEPPIEPALEPALKEDPPKPPINGKHSLTRSSPETQMELLQPGMPSEAEIAAAFKVFWKAYPSTNGKAEAERNFRLAALGKLPELNQRSTKGHPPVALQDMINGAVGYAEEIDRSPKDRSIKHAQGWLTERRWRDYEDGKVSGPRPKETLMGRALMRRIAEEDAEQEADAMIERQKLLSRGH